MTTVEQELTLAPQYETVPMEAAEPVAFFIDPRAPNATLTTLEILHAVDSLDEEEFPRQQVEATCSRLEDCAEASIIVVGKVGIAEQVKELIEEQPWFAHRPLPHTRITGPLDEDGLERTMGALPLLPELIQAANEHVAKIESGEIEEVKPETGREFYERVKSEVDAAKKPRPFSIEEAEVIKTGLYRQALNKNLPSDERRFLMHALLTIERTNGKVLHILLD